MVGYSRLIGLDNAGMLRRRLAADRIRQYRWRGTPEQRNCFRVGINIGDVIPNGTDLHGDGVSIAARLQAECPAGGICVSRSVRDHVHGRLNLPLGQLFKQATTSRGAGPL